MKKHIALILSVVATLGINGYSSGSSDVRDERDNRPKRFPSNGTTPYVMEADQTTCRYPYLPRQREFVGYKGDLAEFRVKNPDNTTFMQRFWKVVETYRNPDSQ